MRKAILYYLLGIIVTGMVLLALLLARAIGSPEDQPQKWCKLIVPVLLQDRPGHVADNPNDQVLLGIGQDLKVLRFTELSTPRGNTDPVIRYYQVEFSAGVNTVWEGFVEETACKIYFVIPGESR